MHPGILSLKSHCPTVHERSCTMMDVAFENHDFNGRNLTGTSRSCSFFATFIMSVDRGANRVNDGQ